MNCTNLSKFENLEIARKNIRTKLLELSDKNYTLNFFNDFCKKFGCEYRINCGECDVSVIFYDKRIIINHSIKITNESIVTEHDKNILIDEFIHILINHYRLSNLGVSFSSISKKKFLEKYNIQKKKETIQKELQICFKEMKRVNDLEVFLSKSGRIYSEAEAY